MATESERPAIDPAEFRRVMGRFASGLTVITAEANGEVRGMTASAFMSGSLDPPLLVVSVGHRATMHGHLQAAGRFGVNILATGHNDIAMHFAGRKIEGLTPPMVSKLGVPLLAEASATMVADVVAAYPCGDHTLFVGHILALDADDRPPLVYHAGKFVSIIVDALKKD